METQVGHIVCQAECPASGDGCGAVSQGGWQSCMREVVGCGGRVLCLHGCAMGENSIHVGMVGGPGGVFHASASVSRWEKGRNG